MITCARHIIIILVLLGQAALCQVTNEAEAALLSNGAMVQDCPYCSGEKRVGGIGGPDNGTVTFSRITTPEAGLYPVTVNVAVGDDRSLEMSVNGEAVPRWLSFHNEAGRNRVTAKTILVPLRRGGNTLRFGNPHEPGPDLDSIVIAAAPVESFRISGSVSVPGVEVTLSGDVERVTVSDNDGHYEFPFLSKGAYYVSPIRPEMGFSPFDRNYAALASNCENQDFTASAPIHRDASVLNWGRWRIEYSPTGVTTIFRDGFLLLSNVYSEIRLPATITSMDFLSHTVNQRAIRDEFGQGQECTVESVSGPDCSMIQTFCLHPEFILVSVKVAAGRRLRSNFIAPLVSHAPVDLPQPGDTRALFVPFDNDKWVRYDTAPFIGSLTSHEVSAFYNSETRAGLIVGSVEHDTWKTGVKATVSGRAIASLEVFGGFASVQSRDVLPHGMVSGNAIVSPRIFVGYFEDWRRGLEVYAGANAAVAPPVSWTNGVPFGWNSWGKLQFRLNFQKALKVSDFFASELQPRHFQDNGVVCVGLDSGWDRMSDEQLKEFVNHCRSNHQQAGIYLAPFAQFGNGDGQVEGTPYTYRDLFLLANGRPQRVDGGIALDPTHPGTRARLQRLIEKFKRAGFTYLKVDFLVHGSLEADHYYDPAVTTGMQAFNSGMKFLRQTIGETMYLNEAISPVFPGCYAQSRRIACDAFGSIAQTEYTLNALTGGWWLNRVYDFLDPDHIVLEGFDEGENRARVTSAVITGLMIAGDDFSAGGERAKKYLTNEAIEQIARQPKFFRPVEGDAGTRAARLFAGRSGDDFCLAVFNYSLAPADFDVDLRRVGWDSDGPMIARELWTGAVTKAQKKLSVHLGPADAALYRFEKLP
jgi:alpha-galactosidase